MVTDRRGDVLGVGCFSSDTFDDIVTNAQHWLTPSHDGFSSNVIQTAGDGPTKNDGNRSATDLFRTNECGQAR